MGCISTKAAAREINPVLAISSDFAPVHDPDHWFEIKLKNENLFESLSLTHIPDLLKGRLFSSRMPRNLMTNIDAKKDFERKCKNYNLDLVLILTEKEEYLRYAEVDIEDFYANLGLQSLVYPIRDYSCPSFSDYLDMIKRVTIALADGKNVLIHCAGGNGRTGLVLCGILKNCGIRDPVNFARKVKPTYVETPEQEEMVNALPLTVAGELFTKHPTLAKVIAIDKLIAASKMKMQENNADKRKLSFMQPNSFSQFRFKRQREDQKPAKTKSQCGDSNGLQTVECAHSDDESNNPHYTKSKSAVELKNIMIQDLDLAFRSLDFKGDRKLSANELRAMFVGIGKDNSSAGDQITLMMEAYGTDDATTIKNKRRRRKTRKVITPEGFNAAMLSEK